jgi:hypothetical protein
MHHSQAKVMCEKVQDSANGNTSDTEQHDHTDNSLSRDQARHPLQYWRRRYSTSAARMRGDT